MIWFFTGHSSIVPSLHRQKVVYFYTFYTSSFILICYLIQYNLSCELQWAMNSQKFLLQAFMSVWFGFFTRPSTIVPLLHRRMACIFKLFTPLASFSYATWSSATFLASWSEPRICWNFYTPLVSITLQPVGLGLFTASSPIVPWLHRLKLSILQLFKPVASFSYATWSSATFLASCSEPWTCGNFNTLI